MPFQHTFGFPYDQEGDNVRVTAVLGDVARFCNWRFLDNTIDCEEGGTTNGDARTYRITITLTDDAEEDDDGQGGPASKTYNIDLKVIRIQEITEEITEWEQENEGTVSD